MTDENKLSRRKVLGGFIAVGAAGAGAGAGTLAYLNDEVSVGSSFETGSLIINVDPQSLEFKDLNEQEESTSKIKVCNVGTLPVRNVVLQNIELSGDNQVARGLEVIGASYANGEVLSDIHNGDQNGNGWVDLEDVVNYLSNNNVSLTSSAEEDGLTTDDEEGTESECNELKLTTKMRYDNITGADHQSVVATISIVAEQEPIS